MLSIINLLQFTQKRALSTKKTRRKLNMGKHVFIAFNMQLNLTVFWRCSTAKAAWLFSKMLLSVFVRLSVGVEQRSPGVLLPREFPPRSPEINLSINLSHFKILHNNWWLIYCPRKTNRVEDYRTVQVLVETLAALRAAEKRSRLLSDPQDASQPLTCCGHGQQRWLMESGKDEKRKES